MPRLHGHWSRDERTGDLQTVHIIERANGPSAQRRDLRLERRDDVLAVTIISALKEDREPETEDLILDRAAIELLHERLGEYLQEMPRAEGIVRPSGSPP